MKYSEGQISTESQIRLKMMSRGESELTNAELLALVMGVESRDFSPIAVSREIVRSIDDNLLELAKIDFNKMRLCGSMGAIRAAAIKAALELGRRYRTMQPEHQSFIGSMLDVEDIFVPLLADLPYEEFWVLYLTSANKVLYKSKISQGSVSATTVDNRLILKRAIERLASGIILVHNHPSGNSEPSSSDRELTFRLKEAAGLFDITLVDHVIISCNGSFSFRNGGLL
jgi:DNA repair protein RadC